MRILKSTQIAIGAVVLAGLGTFAFRFISDKMLGSTNFTNLQPGVVNIVGIDTGKGYAIRVVNQIAQLVEAKGGGFGPSEGSEGEGPTEGSNAKRIPIKDLLASLQGDEDALGHLIMTMNDRGENDDWPPVRNIWKADDIAKALAGDKVLQKKLEEDLNIGLDGTPSPKLRIASYQNGIIVASGVPVSVTVGGQQKTLYGQIQTPYRPDLMSAVDRRLKEKSDITNQMIAGYYTEEAARVISKEVPKENVRAKLHDLIDPEVLKELAVRPGRILNSAKVIVTDKFMTGAKFEQQGEGKDTSYDLTLSFSDEGRRRLWAYSRSRVNVQLLLISNGIAIAAPRIRHELATSELTITQMHDKTLLNEMIATLHGSAK